MRRISWAGLVLATVAVAPSCSTSAASYQDAALKVITDTLQSRVGLGPLDPTCEKPASNRVDTTFECDALTSAGERVRFQATIKSGRKVSVNTANVLLPANLDKVEAEAADILSKRVGVTLPASDIDCGSKARVIESRQPFICTLTDPTNGALFDTQITLDDIDNPRQILVQVATTPRS